MSAEPDRLAWLETIAESQRKTVPMSFFREAVEGWRNLAPSRRYSDDRLSLAQEIADTLRARGFWVPSDYAGPDLITAVGLALDKKLASVSEEQSLLATALDAAGFKVQP